MADEFYTIQRRLPSEPGKPTRNVYFVWHSPWVPSNLDQTLWVPAVNRLPMAIAPRAEYPDGVLKTREEVLNFFFKGDIQITREDAYKFDGPPCLSPAEKCAFIRAILEEDGEKVSDYYNLFQDKAALALFSSAPLLTKEEYELKKKSIAQAVISYRTRTGLPLIICKRIVDTAL